MLQLILSLSNHSEIVFSLCDRKHINMQLAPANKQLIFYLEDDKDTNWVSRSEGTLYISFECVLYLDSHYL